MLASINYSLSFSLNRAGIGDQVQAAFICELCRQAIEEVVGTKRIQPVSFSRGILLVKAPSSIYASELRPRLNSICDYINQHLNKILVERINIVVE